MKKIISIITVFLVLFMLIFSINIYAVSLDNVNVTIDKDTVHPNETIKVDINFGQDLGSYTVDIAYDNNLLEYVSAEGITGTPNDNGTRIRAYFYDDKGGTNPSSSMSVTFKAKEGITTSNPTDLSITAEGLANPDASVNYDDITVPIVKSLIVEPLYEDYNISLNYSGDVIVNEEKDMKIVISSAMGKNYDHTRIIAEAVTPNNGTVKLLATDNANLEHDIIQSGWGPAEGESIGGQNVSKELNVRGIFNEIGNYSITLKLIDRDNSDAVIATKDFQIAVKEKATTTPPTTEDDNQNIENNNTTTENENTATDNTTTPNNLPQTGNTIYFAIISLIVILLVAYMYLKRKD